MGELNPSATHEPAFDPLAGQTADLSLDPVYWQGRHWRAVERLALINQAEITGDAEKLARLQASAQNDLPISILHEAAGLAITEFIDVD